MTIKEMFPDFENVEFPAALCNVRNVREPEVMDSEALFLCVLVDMRFPTQFRAEHLHPYTAVDVHGYGAEGVRGAVLYGWTDGNNWYDHQDNSVHEDDERVVAWKRIESGTPTTYETPWKDAQ